MKRETTYGKSYTSHSPFPVNQNSTAKYHTVEMHKYLKFAVQNKKRKKKKICKNLSFIKLRKILKMTRYGIHPVRHT